MDGLEPFHEDEAYAQTVAVVLEGLLGELIQARVSYRLQGCDLDQVFQYFLGSLVRDGHVRVQSSSFAGVDHSGRQRTIAIAESCSRH